MGCQVRKLSCHTQSTLAPDVPKEAATGSTQLLMGIYLFLTFFQAQKWSRTNCLLPQTHQWEAESGLHMLMLMVSSLGSVLTGQKKKKKKRSLVNPSVQSVNSNSLFFFKSFNEEVSGFNTVAHKWLGRAFSVAAKICEKEPRSKAQSSLYVQCTCVYPYMHVWGKCTCMYMHKKPSVFLHCCSLYLLRQGLSLSLGLTHRLA